MATLPTNTMYLRVGTKLYEVASFEHASKMFEKARDAALARGIDPAKLHGQMIVDDTGRVIANVSYNGRVWPGADYQRDAVPLYDNRMVPA